MDRNIQIEIRDRIAYLTGNPKIICGNDDYRVTFTFDDEWSDINVKTLRVSYNNQFSDHVFTGNVVTLPPIIKAIEVHIGVFAGDITSTKVSVRAEPSIRCLGGSVADPEPDVYGQIINLLNEINESEVTPEQIADAVSGYLEENPIEMFETDETLILDPNTNVLSVNVTDHVSEGIDLPVTSDAVAKEIKEKIDGKLDESDLSDAINIALAQAKESGEFDGEDGRTPVKGEDYFDGENGVGIESITTIVESPGSSFQNVYEITLTDGSKYTFSTFNGEEGEPGLSGTSVRIDSFSETPDEYRLIISDASGSETLVIPKGKNGEDGYTPVKGVDYFDGKDGYTPEKGKDYYTEADKKEMVNLVLTALPAAEGASY